MSILWQYKFLLFIWLLAALLVGCTASSGAPTATPSLALTTVFPDEITGWRPAEEARLYNRENIFNLVNGQAEAFFVYGFEQVAVRTYAGTGVGLGTGMGAGMGMGQMMAGMFSQLRLAARQQGLNRSRILWTFPRPLNIWGLLLRNQ